MKPIKFEFMVSEVIEYDLEFITLEKVRGTYVHY